MAASKIASGLHAAVIVPVSSLIRYVDDKIRRVAVVMAGVGHATRAHTCALSRHVARAKAAISPVFPMSRPRVMCAYARAKFDSAVIRRRNRLHRVISSLTGDLLA